MNLQFLGATGTVTGSKYLLQHKGVKVLIDCGLFQGYKQLRLRNWASLPVPASEIDAVVLTHAHIDHSGYIPLLVKQGFAGKVFCTEATRALCGILLPDSGYLQEEEANYANRHGFSKHQPALPLYTRADAEKCLGRFASVDFHTSWHLSPGLEAVFIPSGHMLGSAFVHIRSEQRSILFSGDIGRPEDLVLAAPEKVPGADYLVVESTYGNRLHEQGDPLDKLAEVINRTAARGGAVIIPAFAVGRAQSLLYCLYLLKSRGAIAHLPIYLNSPMAANATEIYRKYRSQHRLTPEQCEAMCSAAHIVNSPEESESLNRKKGPMVIIAASGMATGGRVVHHLKAFLPHERNTVLFAGYQAGGTRGAAMLAGARTIRIHGTEVPVLAHIDALTSFSAHADAAEIIQWLKAFAKPPLRTFITHGEPDAADAMRQRIERELGWACHLPDYLESVALE
ncbi:MBL fold metallo-hydrolase RNA specificity domain-containing protein [Polaromonas sp.]|uniref:MBL fold metallo-hydrolase RNA specificity domain-containing protein n=1 Tax=Polaromonas sp. TaxID=1869339 RepID=UPI003BAC8E2A